MALCKLLLEAPDLLLLDEPTNHLDAESILWLEQFLHQYKGAVIAVTHDRYFMDNVAEWICEVDRGHLYPYKGNYSTYLETKAKRLEIQGAKDAKLAKRLKNELEWVRSSPKARQAKNKARLERYDQMENEARNNKKLDFSEIQIPAGPRLGSVVLEAEHLPTAFGDRVLIDDLSFTLPRNGIVGVIGPNGRGKSTLFKTIVALEPLTSGELKIGDTVKISYVDQNREGLDPNKNLWEAVSGGLDFIEVAGVEVPTRAYVASFGFKGSDQQKLTGVLSGGERNRLNLALTLKQGGNLLLLDEPTNDLDVETLESLENALLGFPGCAVVISHDRWFLDRIATHILAWEGDDENPAKWYWFEGNFQAYQENRVARLGEDAARPHRLHKKLTREFTGTFTGKGLEFGGSLIRPEATGFGGLYFVYQMLQAKNIDIKGKTVAISGFGNVAWGAATKATELGAKVITISGPDGYIYDPDGISGEKIDYMLELRASGNDIVAPYAEKYPGATFVEGKRPWEVKADIALPCATQNELNGEDAQNLIKNNVLCIGEISNMGCTPEAIDLFIEKKIMYAPGKAVNAGGVATSGLEMSQNAMHLSWSAAEVDEKLHAIMHGIHAQCVKYGTEPDGYINYVKGANIAGFMKVAHAMMGQGVI